ncbi:hypothetical protein [Pseudomonas savastanoi]|uniref:Uncharacterized protein n=1 Tax=Pseudomonas savastanoi TaxID=29438 RepID=A0AAW3M8B7_PSESS|nr:hypothetical protein [Pseudomonas savastanoi]KTC62402.1 hypothetical protein AO287_26420 [Pseudomonas savastanoi]
MNMSNYNHEEESTELKQILADLELHLKTETVSETDHEKHKAESIKRVMVGDKFVSGLPINTIRHLIIPCILAFLIYRNLSSLFAYGSGMMVVLNVISILFFTSVAVCASFNFLKAQIALRASTFEQRTNVAKISLRRILLEGGDAEGSFLLRRQGLILELVAGLVLPTMVFIVTYVVMDTLNIFAVNVVYVVLALVVLIAFLNVPINAMRARALEELKRFM